MDQNTAGFDLFFDKLEKFVKELDEILIFMVEHRIYDVFDVVLRLVDDLIHTGGSSDNWKDKKKCTGLDIGNVNKFQIEGWRHIP